MVNRTTLKFSANWLLDHSYLLALAGCTMLVVTTVLPEGSKAERAQREQLCRNAVQELIQATDSVSVERGAFLIKELDCEVVKASLAE